MSLSRRSARLLRVRVSRAVRVLARVAAPSAAAVRAVLAQSTPAERAAFCATVRSRRGR